MRHYLKGLTYKRYIAINQEKKMKSTDEEREQRLSLLRGVEEEILTFVFNLDRKYIYRALDPNGEAEKIAKKISKKTPYPEGDFFYIILQAVFDFFDGCGTEEERKKKTTRKLKSSITRLSKKEPPKTWLKQLLSRFNQ